MPSISTDHSIISLTLNISQTQQRGKGIWKFNNSLLKDANYVNLVKKTINDIKIENPFSNKCTLWEYVKYKVRSETMVYASQKAKLKKKREFELLSMLEELEKQLNSEADQVAQTEYFNLKKELEDIYKDL